MQTLELVEVEIDFAEIRKSLNRSKLRIMILKYLLKNGSDYISEIARGVFSDPSNVKGALEGLGIRWKEQHSLVGLGLVMQNGNNYCITMLGKKALEIVSRKHNVIEL